MRDAMSTPREWLRARLSPASRALWILFAADAFGLTALFVTAGATRYQTILPPLLELAHWRQLEDSWRPMRMAFAYLRQPHSVPVYQALVIARGIKFQYPLSSLLLTWTAPPATLTLVSAIALATTAYATWWTLIHTPGWAFRRHWADRCSALLVVFALTLSFLPVTEAYWLGQIQTWVTACVAVAIAAWTAECDEFAGAALGLATLMKPTYLLFVLWAADRRRWRFAATLAGTFCAGTLVSAAAFGWREVLDYLPVLRLIGQRGEAYAPNQSFNGFLNRLLNNGDSLHFTRGEFAPYHPVVYLGTLAAFVIVVALALWAPRRTPLRASAFDLCLFLLAITVSMPVAWDHHYGVLIAVFAVLVPVVRARRVAGALTTAVLVGCYALISQNLGILGRLPVVRWLTQSLLFFAALALLALMAASARRPAR
jgi:alpha-1,2-mannosyltransferase